MAPACARGPSLRAQESFATPEKSKSEKKKTNEKGRSKKKNSDLFHITFKNYSTAPGLRLVNPDVADSSRDELEAHRPSCGARKLVLHELRLPIPHPRGHLRTHLTKETQEQEKKVRRSTRGGKRKKSKYAVDTGVHGKTGRWDGSPTTILDHYVIPGPIPDLESLDEVAPKKFLVNNGPQVSPLDVLDLSFWAEYLDGCPEVD